MIRRWKNTTAVVPLLVAILVSRGEAVWQPELEVLSLESHIHAEFSGYDGYSLYDYTGAGLSGTLSPDLPSGPYLTTTAGGGPLGISGGFTLAAYVEGKKGAVYNYDPDDPSWREEIPGPEGFAIATTTVTFRTMGSGGSLWGLPTAFGDGMDPFTPAASYVELEDLATGTMLSYGGWPLGLDWCLFPADPSHTYRATVGAKLWPGTDYYFCGARLDLWPSYPPPDVPAPAALMLATLGAGLAAWLRRRSLL
jgi:hypothetical protein